MKKVLLNSLILLLFASCSTSDDAVPEKEEEIVGKWFVVSISTNGEEYNFITPCEKGSYLELFLNSSAIENMIDQEEPCEYDQATYDYLLTGNLLEFIDPEGEAPPRTWDILTLKGDNLVLREDSIVIKLKKE